MLVLSGADIVLPDRILSPGTLAIADGRIAAVAPDATGIDPSSRVVELRGHTILPGFIDVHVHGLDGTDTLDDGEAIARMAGRLPRCGVTAFCPTTVACAPDALAHVLRQVRALTGRPAPGSARVLRAHLESNFISPEYRGAQPLACLRSWPGRVGKAWGAGEAGGAFDVHDVLRVIEQYAAEVGIVTLAPELDGALDLIAWLRVRNMRVSMGHSGATFEQACAAIEAGATQATHLFNAMPPLHHRAPGLAGAVLDSSEVAAEVIGDGVHVHPSVIAWTVAVKGADRVMAITDGTAAMGLTEGATATLGGQLLTVRDGAARLADGSLAGGVVPMDGVYRNLVGHAGLSPVAAATLCATTPARTLGRADLGAIEVGAVADLVVLDSRLAITHTYVAGEVAYKL
jgi:N-acetylglucosamine-6-phosphate deacetylase